MYEILANYWILDLSFEHMPTELIINMRGAAWCDFCYTQDEPLFLVVGTYGSDRRPLLNCIVCNTCKSKVNNLKLLSSLQGRPKEST